MTFYHDDMRYLQDRYEGRAVADRLEEHRVHQEFNDDDRAFIAQAAFFFLATAGPDNVDCSFKGGVPGFVRVTGPTELAFPDYDGNRMYRSLGNIRHNPLVGLLFLQFDGALFDGKAARLRVNGRAAIDESPAALEGVPGAKRIIRVAVDHIYPNCPRYIPSMQMQDLSVHAPRDGHVPPEPAWKDRPMVKDIFDREREGRHED